jgi:hypothetical protein
LTDPDVPDSSGVKSSPSSRRGIAFGHLDRLNEHPMIKTLVMIGELVGLAVLIVSGFVGLAHWLNPGDPATTESPEPTAVTSGALLTSPPPASSSTSASPAAAGPGCWTSRRTAVDCRDQHRFEEIPQASSCDLTAVVDFLGGQPALDVTTARVAKSPSDGCAVDAGREVSGSVRDALRGEAGAGWRRCVDRRVTKNVACSALHSGEYVATGSARRATVAECQLAAAKYLDQVPGALVEDLDVRVFDIPGGTKDPARCIIDARGNHILTTSVRDLGSRPVPIFSQ